MNEEKILFYVAPNVEIIEVAVECGFANSGNEDYEDGGIW